MSENESIVPVESGLGQSVVRFVEKQFPGSMVSGINSEYQSGLFIGDYCISLDVVLEKGIAQRVGLWFTHHEVKHRAGTWKELLALPDIELYMNSVTFGDTTFKTRHCMFDREIAAWTEENGDPAFGTIETRDMFAVVGMSNAARAVLTDAVQYAQQHVDELICMDGAYYKSAGYAFGGDDVTYRNQLQRLAEDLPLPSPRPKASPVAAEPIDFEL